MRDNFKDKYRIESARLRKWDYGSNASYYITICTGGRECYFGEIVEGHMILSEIGEIAKTEWLKSPEIRPDMNLILDDYIIMPNHIHGIIQIGDNEYNKYDDGIIAGCDCRCGDAVHGRDAMHGVSTTTTNNELAQNRGNKFGPQRKNLSSLSDDQAGIIRGFKSAVTTNARTINPYFAWQS